MHLYLRLVRATSKKCSTSDFVPGYPLHLCNLLIVILRVSGQSQSDINLDIGVSVFCQEAK